MFVGEHDRRIADLHLRMSDFPVRSIHPKQFDRAKGALVKVEHALAAPSTTRYGVTL